LLLRAKELVEHGQWLLWLAENIDFTPRQAQKLMRLASKWNEIQAAPNANSGTHLTSINGAPRYPVGARRCNRATHNQQPKRHSGSAGLRTATRGTSDKTGGTKRAVRGGAKQPILSLTDAASEGADEEATHPFEELRQRVIDLTRDINRALNTDDESAKRLRHLMVLVGVALFEPRLSADESQSRCEFFALLGIPKLLALAIDTKPLKSDSTIKAEYLQAARAWIPPAVLLEQERKANRLRKADWK
jgi:hypothetical protein